MSSRDAFEKWAQSEGYRVVRTDCGLYDMPTIYAWEVWQAATERAARVCDELCHPQGDGWMTDEWVAGTLHCAEALREGNETLTGEEK